MVYFGANDGFIHAVNGTETGVDAGKELFAYMPSELLRTGPTGVAALTYKPTDNLPNRFAHRFYVDGQLVVRDVDFSRTTQIAATPTPTPTSGQSPDWHSVLIAGLGKGGMSYVALDVTNPVAATEAEMVTNKRVLWEFTDPDMGFTYGKPVIAKTARYGWVALLPSGYNNPTGPNAGKGVLFVVDVKTGTLLHKFITPEGSAADPIGMAQINGFVPDVTDFTVTELYATDVEGNIWRFDLLPTTPYLSTGVKFAQLRSSLNQKQPITAYPVPYIEPLSGKRFVAVGTGKLFAAADLTDLSQQTIYNIQDGTVYEPKTTGLPIVRAGLTSIARTADQANLPSTNVGWYTDLRTDGERVVKPVLAQFGVVVAFSIAPSADPCNRGGVGTAYARGAVTGNNLITGTGNPWLSSLSGDPIITGRVIKTSQGKPLVQIISGSGKISTIDNLQFPGGFKGSVVNYREVIE